ncbi:MAG TPA: bifunctional phosphopantothenoylcysteine decarboxylase/phosphopantothenate--cysteine ligase CoaBC [Acidimicrobiales bacterium]|nr:bifunctional phosphopantothenoylcysteine decarboxylase/phosphopantothenate--cysteine ligase CoaBC [Acidimicrobiales bacterium]
MSAAPHVVLGVAGGIAAYKAVEVCRRLTDAGCEVAPVLTEAATHFVAPLTFSALAAQPARTSLFGDAADPIPHTRLGQWADAIVVAPATADLLARYASGMANDLLTATLLATRATVVVCPAMHTEMWEHPSVTDNLAVLVSRGVIVVPPEVGRLAGGDEGAGRMADPARITAAVLGILDPGDRPLAGRTVLVTAGGTREPIDPVRVLTNRSSGRQGHAVAEAAARRGAHVVLVTASPLALDDAVASRVVRRDVGTAAEMHAAVLGALDDADVVVMAAAVADFRPVQGASQKLRRADGAPDIELEPTEDILADVVAKRHDKLLIVGFAAETNDAVASARDKLERKGCDFVVVNDVSKPGVGFDHDTNEVVILGRDGSEEHVALTSKRAVADALLDSVARRLAQGA